MNIHNLIFASVEDYWYNFVAEYLLLTNAYIKYPQNQTCEKEQEECSWCTARMTSGQVKINHSA